MTLLHFFKITLALLLVFAVAAPVVITEGAVHIHDRPVAGPAEADYLARADGASCQAVAIQAADGIELQAWFFRPPDFNGAAVLLMHGVADTRLGMSYHLPYLLHSGYAVLTPDARGHGSSGGNLVTYGVKEADDTVKWAQWMLRQPGVNRIYALGESMGASVLIQSLADHPGFRAIVAESPFSTFAEISEYRVGQKLLPLVAWPVVKIASVYARLKYGVDVMQASPLEALRHASTPVLLIHGTADTNVPIAEARELHAANPQYTELWEVPDARHVMALEAYPMEYRKRVLAWFAAH